MITRYDFYENPHSHSPQLLYFIKDTCAGAYHEKLFTHNIAEIYFVIDGNGLLRLKNKLFTLQTNCFAFINPYVSHGEFVNKDEAFNYYILGISNLKIPSSSAISPDQPLHLDSNSRIILLLNLIFEELNNQHTNYLNAVSNYFNVLLTEIERAYKTSYILPDAKSPMVKIKDYIDANCFGNISSQNVADTFHMKLNTLEVNFKKSYKVSIQQYILLKLIEEAKSKLKNDDLSVTDIALRVGFNSPAYFSKYFKKITGMTPMQYRKEYQNATNDNEP